MKNKNIQSRICMHCGEGVCNIVMDVRDFYAENIKSSYRVPCLYYNVEVK